jgi:hypothetical protein
MAISGGVVKLKDPNSEGVFLMISFKLIVINLT